MLGMENIFFGELSRINFIILVEANAMNIYEYWVIHVIPGS